VREALGLSLASVGRRLRTRAKSFSASLACCSSNSDHHAPQVFPYETVSRRAAETAASEGLRVAVLLQDAGPWPSRGHPRKRAPGARYQPATYKAFPTNTRPDAGGTVAHGGGAQSRRDVDGVPRDLMKLTSCQRCDSGSLDQTGMPRRTTPLVSIEKMAPGAAF
jgi:hypothetical protein